MLTGTGRGYGPAIVGREIQYFSPSSLNSADATQDGGCLRRYLFKYLLGHKEPFTGSQKLGVETHTSIQTHLDTGAMVLNRLALAASHFIPKPGTPGMSVEKKMQGVLFKKSTGAFVRFAHKPVLTVAGVRLVGEIDLILTPVDGKSTYIDPDGQVQQDPDHTVEVLDWKTTSNLRYAKTGPALLDTNQMIIYGAYVLAKYPKARGVRLSHVYMQSKSTPKTCKATIWISREDLTERFKRIEILAQEIKGMVRSFTEIEKIARTEKSCGAYSGCPHGAVKGRCPISEQDTIDKVFGLSTDIDDETKEKNMIDIMASLETLPETVADKVAVATFPAGFDKVVEALETLTGADSKPLGLPNMSGDIALAYCAVKGLEPCEDILGNGPLATVQNNLSWEKLYEITKVEFVGLAVAPAPVIPPTVASDFIDEYVPVEKGSEEILDAAPVKKKRTRRTKAQIAADNAAASAPVAVAPVPVAVAPVPVAPVANVVRDIPNGVLFVNTNPSWPVDPITDYLDTVLDLIKGHTGATDIRCSEHEKLGFGKWKGTLAAMIRENPPAEGKSYTINTGTELMAEAHATLITIMAGHTRGTS